MSEKARERLAALDRMKATYKEYAKQRLEEEDWHGLWDVAINLSETSCERDGLLLAMEGGDFVRTVTGEWFPGWRVK